MREHVVSARFETGERLEIEIAAEARGETLSQMVRAAVLREARNEIGRVLERVEQRWPIGADAHEDPA